MKAILTESFNEGEDMDDFSIKHDFNFTQELSTRLQQVHDVAKALEVLLISLEMDRGIVSHHAEADESNPSENICVPKNRVFASEIGASIVAESLKRMTQTRFELTRDLIILQLLMLECGLTDSVSADTAEQIHSTFLPRSVVMAHCYFVLVWLTQTTATAPPANSL